MLSRYGRLGASSRMRFYQYLPWLEAAGIHVTQTPLFSDAYVQGLQRNTKSPLEALRAYAGRIQALLAHYIEGKGHLHTVHAFAHAYGENPALRLRFVGADLGLEKNRALKKLLALTAVQMGIKHVFIFRGYSDDVELEIKNADIVLNFSESESFSHTCFEACAFGWTIIVTRCGGPEEIFEDGISGLLVPVGAVDEIAHAIPKLSAEPAMKLEMGGAGPHTVRLRFSEGAFVGKFKSIVGLRNQGF